MRGLSPGPDRGGRGRDGGVETVLAVDEHGGHVEAGALAAAAEEEARAADEDDDGDGADARERDDRAARPVLLRRAAVRAGGKEDGRGGGCAALGRGSACGEMQLCIYGGAADSRDEGRQVDDDEAVAEGHDREVVHDVRVEARRGPRGGGGGGRGGELDTREPAAVQKDVRGAEGLDDGVREWGRQPADGRGCAGTAGQRWRRGRRRTCLGNGAPRGRRARGWHGTCGSPRRRRRTWLEVSGARTAGRRAHKAHGGDNAPGVVARRREGRRIDRAAVETVWRCERELRGGRVRRGGGGGPGADDGGEDEEQQQRGSHSAGGAASSGHGDGERLDTSRTWGETE